MKPNGLLTTDKVTGSPETMSLESLIIAYGYPALFAGTFLEGETIVVIAGFLAHRGYRWPHCHRYFSAWLSPARCACPGISRYPASVYGYCPALREASLIVTSLKKWEGEEKVAQK